MFHFSRRLAARALSFASSREQREASALLYLALAMDPTDPDALLIIAFAARACERPKDAIFAAARAARSARVSPASRELLTKTWPSTTR